MATVLYIKTNTGTKKIKVAEPGDLVLRSLKEIDTFISGAFSKKSGAALLPGTSRGFLQSSSDAVSNAKKKFIDSFNGEDNTGNIAVYKYKDNKYSHVKIVLDSVFNITKIDNTPVTNEDTPKKKDIENYYVLVPNRSMMAKQSKYTYIMAPPLEDVDKLLKKAQHNTQTFTERKKYYLPSIPFRKKKADEAKDTKETKGTDTEKAPGTGEKKTEGAGTGTGGGKNKQKVFKKTKLSKKKKSVKSKNKRANKKKSKKSKTSKKKSNGKKKKSPKSKKASKKSPKSKKASKKSPKSKKSKK
jgi:hypothetical protein